MFIPFTLIGPLLFAAPAITRLVSPLAIPWDLLPNGLPVLALLLLPPLFPFSEPLWLAFDLMLRPVIPAELEWHRRTDAEFSSERDASRE